MRLHRFYVAPDTELTQDFWIHDPQLVNQWRKVLRLQAGQEVVLFDGQQHDRLYKIVELTEREAHVRLVTEFVRQLPAKEIYLFWALIKNDKNEWVLQKGTELGVSHFIPLLADRSEKTGLNHERAAKIIREAAEQCGRSDLPLIREPMHVQTAIDEYQGKIELFFAEQQTENAADDRMKNQKAGIFIGPEGGWSDEEKTLFQNRGVNPLKLHDFTLRAETAAVTAIARLQM